MDATAEGQHRCRALPDDVETIGVVVDRGIAHQVIAENLGAVRAQRDRCLLVGLPDDAVRLVRVLGFLIEEGRLGDGKEVGGVRVESHDVDYRSVPAADHQ